MAKPPSSLPPTSSAPFSVTLLLGTSGHPSASLELFELHVLASRAPSVHPVLPEIQHIFRADPKLPPRAVSAFAAGAALALVGGLHKRFKRTASVREGCIGWEGMASKARIGLAPACITVSFNH